MKRILIIDDKDKSEALSSRELVDTLSSNQRVLIELETSVKDLWNLNKDEDRIISLNFNPDQYQFIFLHQSINDPILDNPDLLIEHLPKDCYLTLFSGGRSESLSYNSDNGYNHSWANIGMHYEIRRAVYFENFPQFINTYIHLGQFNIQALYDSKFNPEKERAFALVRAIKIKLEDSLQNAINSEEFKELLDLNGYASSSEREKIKRNCLTFDDNEFIETIEDLSVNL